METEQKSFEIMRDGFETQKLFGDIIEALGVAPGITKRVTINHEAGEYPTIELEMFVPLTLDPLIRRIVVTSEDRGWPPVSKPPKAPPRPARP